MAFPASRSSERVSPMTRREIERLKRASSPSPARDCTAPDSCPGMDERKASNPSGNCTSCCSNKVATRTLATTHCCASWRASRRRSTRVSGVANPHAEPDRLGGCATSVGHFVRYVGRWGTCVGGCARCVGDYAAYVGACDGPAVRVCWVSVRALRLSETLSHIEGARVPRLDPLDSRFALVNRRCAPLTKIS